MIDIEKVRKDFTTIKEEFVNQCDNYIRGEKPLSTLDKAISELERLQQKETPMKPLNGDMCPNCKKPLFGEEDSYCPQCGKHIDWSDKE